MCSVTLGCTGLNLESISVPGSFSPFPTCSSRSLWPGYGSCSSLLDHGKSWSGYGSCYSLLDRGKTWPGSGSCFSLLVHGKSWSGCGSCFSSLNHCKSWPGYALAVAHVALYLTTVSLRSPKCKPENKAYAYISRIKNSFNEPIHLKEASILIIYLEINVEN